MTTLTFSERDEAYKQILHHGMQCLQQLLHSGELELALIEIEHLHNLPSLIAEANIERHQYYFSKEKAYYETKLQTKGTERHMRFVKMFYEPSWRTLQSFL